MPRLVIPAHARESCGDRFHSGGEFLSQRTLSSARIPARGRESAPRRAPHRHAPPRPGSGGHSPLLKAHTHRPAHRPRSGTHPAHPSPAGHSGDPSCRGIHGPGHHGPSWYPRAVASAPAPVRNRCSGSPRYRPIQDPLIPLASSGAQLPWQGCPPPARSPTLPRSQPPQCALSLSLEAPLRCRGNLSSPGGKLADLLPSPGPSRGPSRRKQRGDLPPAPGGGALPRPGPQFLLQQVHPELPPVHVRGLRGQRQQLRNPGGLRGSLLEDSE